jgi:hypothetical protein
MDTENEDLVQFYATIIDSSFPYKIDDNKYMCNLKVIDPSVHTGDKEGEFAIVLIVGRRF